GAFLIGMPRGTDGIVDIRRIAGRDLGEHLAVGRCEDVDHLARFRRAPLVVDKNALCGEDRGSGNIHRRLLLTSGRAGLVATGGVTVGRKLGDATARGKDGFALAASRIRYACLPPRAQGVMTWRTVEPSARRSNASLMSSSVPRLVISR